MGASSANHPEGGGGLLDPYSLQGLPLSSRIYLSPMTRGRGEAGALQAEYYSQRLRKGTFGVTEATGVSEEGVGLEDAPGIWHEGQVEGWQQVTQAVHDAGGVIFCQLAHSAWGRGRFAHEELDTEGMVNVINLYSKAAANAKRAGFDGVEVQMARGFFLDQCMSDTNVRTDGYGGTTEGRIRLPIEVVRAVVKEWGSPGRVGVRISPHDTQFGIERADPTTIVSQLARGLDALTEPIAYLHVHNAPPPYYYKGPRIECRELRQWFKGTILAAGGYTRESGSELIRKGHADMVGFGRMFISNPDLPERFRKGLKLAPSAQHTWFGGGRRGYTDYPEADGGPP